MTIHCRQPPTMWIYRIHSVRCSKLNGKISIKKPYGLCSLMMPPCIRCSGCIPLPIIDRMPNDINNQCIYYNKNLCCVVDPASDYIPAILQDNTFCFIRPCLECPKGFSTVIISMYLLFIKVFFLFCSCTNLFAILPT